MFMLLPSDWSLIVFISPTQFDNPAVIVLVYEAPDADISAVLVCAPPSVPVGVEKMGGSDPVNAKDCSSHCLNLLNYHQQSTHHRLLFDRIPPAAARSRQSKFVMPCPYPLELVFQSCPSLAGKP